MLEGQQGNQPVNQPPVPTPGEPAPPSPGGTGASPTNNVPTELPTDPKAIKALLGDRLNSDPLFAALVRSLESQKEEARREAIAERQKGKKTTEQIQMEKGEFEPILADRDRTIQTLTAERDDYKTKYEDLQSRLDKTESGRKAALLQRIPEGERTGFESLNVDALEVLVARLYPGGAQPEQPRSSQHGQRPAATGSEAIKDADKIIGVGRLRDAYNTK